MSIVELKEKLVSLIDDFLKSDKDYQYDDIEDIIDVIIDFVIEDAVNKNLNVIFVGKLLNGFKVNVVKTRLDMTSNELLLEYNIESSDTGEKLLVENLVAPLYEVKNGLTIEKITKFDRLIEQMSDSYVISSYKVR